MKNDLRTLLMARRSIRAFSDTRLSRADLLTILWAGWGRNDYKFTAPSAGALNPLNLYVLARAVKGYEPFSVLRWDVDDEDLEVFTVLREEQFDRLCGSNAFATAPASILIAANVERTAKKYVQRALRYVYIECGHVAQNILLQCVDLGLGAVPVGATQDQLIQRITGIPELPCYMVIIGHPS